MKPTKLHAYIGCALLAMLGGWIIAEFGAVVGDALLATAAYIAGRVQEGEWLPKPATLGAIPEKERD